MNHKKIKDEDIVDRYILGKLSPEEKKLFEEHYFGCEQCLNAVQEAETVISGLKDLARSGELVITGANTESPQKAFAWLKSLFMRPSFSYALIAFVLVLAYPAWRGIVMVSRLQSELLELHQPQANAQSYYLELTRAGEITEGTEILVAPGEETFVLNFNILKSAITSPRYRAEIIDQKNKVIWKAEDLKGAGDYEIFSIACQSSFFKEGNYILKVQEINPDDGKIVNEYAFPFTITFGEEIREKQ